MALVLGKGIFRYFYIYCFVKEAFWLAILNEEFIEFWILYPRFLKIHNGSYKG